MEVVDLNVDDLRHYERNQEVFGNSPSDEFVDTVHDAGGIRHPITVSHDMRVVCGNKRLSAAVILGHKTIKARVLPEMDERDLELYWLTGNQHNELSVSQKKKAYDLWVERLDKPKAAARKEAAAKVGTSVRTLQRANQVAQKVAELKAEGKTEQAKQLVQKMEEAGPGAAVKALKPKAKGQFDFTELDKLFRQMRRAADVAFEEFGGMNGPIHRQFLEILDHADGYLKEAVVANR